MKQTRLVSLVEVLLNVGSGFILAMLVWHYVIPEFFPRMAGPVSENVVVTAIFTIVSITRSYIWRRLFNNGFINSIVFCWNWIRVRVMSESPAAGDDSGKVGGDTRLYHDQGSFVVYPRCFCERCLAVRMRVEDDLGG